jgi:hypothetical protein
MKSWIGPALCGITVGAATMQMGSVTEKLIVVVACLITYTIGLAFVD